MDATIPSEVLIDGMLWEVKHADLTLRQYGECRPEDCQIVIANRLSHQMADQTFFHEILHAIAATRSFQEAREKMDEETIASLYGPAIHSFMRANATITWNSPPIKD